jgi:glycerol-3-phosphate dehydrogenase (NAD(P)+)
MRIGYLGAGTWGFALAAVLAGNGHHVMMWTRDAAFAELLEKTRVHPKLPGITASSLITFTSDLQKTVRQAEVIIESVTASGIRSVFEQVGPIHVPIILTSKGIERGSGLLLPELLSTMYDRNLIGVLSGPSHAEDIIQQMPTSVVSSAYDPAVMKQVQELFTTLNFRIYPNSDVLGVCFGGAMKNIIAIACGIADGLGCGDNTKAAIMTRGLHEIRKLSVTKHCKQETLNGLSGMGDLCVTCMSKHSRNYRFGSLIAEGFSPEGARQKIGMAVEGIYTCVAAHELAKAHKIQVPITEAIYQIVYGDLDPREAVKVLLQRAIKEEHL